MAQEQDSQNQQPDDRQGDISSQDPYEASSPSYDVPDAYNTPAQNPHELSRRERYIRQYEAGHGHDDRSSNRDRNQEYAGRSQRSANHSELAPENHPLPLGQAIRELPEQYGNVLTKPSPKTLTGEMTKSAWNIVWVQLLISIIASGIFGYLASITSPERYNFTNPDGGYYFDANFVRVINFMFSFGSIIVVPLSFFISVGLLYWLARAFGGKGTFLRQSYVTLLWDVPLGIISGLATAIPIFGGLISLGLLVYGIVLQVFTIKAVHGLDTGRAVAVVLSLVGVLFLIACAAGVIIAAAITVTSP